VNEEQFKARTKKLALEVIRLVESLPRSRTADIIGRQLLRSATSVGANYRASCRARSFEEVISKLSIVEEEGDESLYWLELLTESGVVDRASVAWIMGEMNEIVSMTVSSKKTLKSRINAKGFATTSPRIGNRES